MSVCLYGYSQQQTDHECNRSRHENGLIDRLVLSYPIADMEQDT